MEIKEIYPRILDAAHALVPYYDPTVCRAGEEYGLDGPETYLLLALPGFEPDPISVALLNIRSPYTAPEIYVRRLDSLARSGLLSSKDAEHYHLTERGKRAYSYILSCANNAMASLAPLASNDLKELASLLSDRVAASLAAPEPPGKWCVTHSRKMDPGPGVAEVVSIDQYISDLLAYRDDAHLASWKAHEIGGHTWDVLTLLWLNESESIDTILQKLARRGNSFQQTEDAVKILVKRHWADLSLGKITITTEGRQTRQTAETMTDEYFYSPWKTMSEKHFQRLFELLVSYKNGLNA